MNIAAQKAKMIVLISKRSKPGPRSTMGSRPIHLAGKEITPGLEGGMVEAKRIPNFSGSRLAWHLLLGVGGVVNESRNYGRRLL